MDFFFHYQETDCSSTEVECVTHCRKTSVHHPSGRRYYVDSIDNRIYCLVLHYTYRLLSGNVNYHIGLIRLCEHHLFQVNDLVVVRRHGAYHGFTCEHVREILATRQCVDRVLNWNGTQDRQGRVRVKCEKFVSISPFNFLHILTLTWHFMLHCYCEYQHLIVVCSSRQLRLVELCQETYTISLRGFKPSSLVVAHLYRHSCCSVFKRGWRYIEVQFSRSKAAVQSNVGRFLRGIVKSMTGINLLKNNSQVVRKHQTFGFRKCSYNCEMSHFQQFCFN